MDKDYSSADSSFIYIPPNEWNFDNIVFIMKRNFESNIPMGYRRKIERAQMMERSDVYGTDIFNDGITASIREVSPCRDRVCESLIPQWVRLIVRNMRQTLKALMLNDLSRRTCF